MHSLLWLNSFGMHLFFWGVVLGSFSCAFSGVIKAGSFVEHGCDLGSLDSLSEWKLKADKLIPSNTDVWIQKVQPRRGGSLIFLMGSDALIGLDMKASCYTWL